MYLTRADSGSTTRTTITPATTGPVMVRTATLSSTAAGAGREPARAGRLPAAVIEQLRGASTSGSQDAVAKRLVKVAISAAVALGDRLPGRRPLADRAAGLVLLYHDVPPAEAARFARQLDMLRAAGVPTACSDLPPRPDGRWHIAVTFDDALYSFEQIALPELHARAIPTTMFAISGLLRTSDRDVSPTHEGMPVMTKAALAELPATGHEIGSHTARHPRLSRLDDAEAFDELRTSRAQLEALTGRPVTTLAFPYGDWNGRTLELAVEAGYTQAYSVLPDLVGTPDDHPVLVGRIVVAPTDWTIETWLKLRGSYRWVARWAHFKARRAGHG